MPRFIIKIIFRGIWIIFLKDKQSFLRYIETVEIGLTAALKE